MGKFDKLAKFLGVAVEKYGDDAAKILEKIDNPELAVSLEGKPREEYLKALDQVYGNQAQRAESMGFGPEKYYHGTNQDIKEFNPNINKTSMLGEGSYLTSDPYYSNIFANSEKGNVLPLKIKKGNYLNENKSEGLANSIVNNLLENRGKNNFFPEDLKELKKSINKLPYDTKEKALLQSLYDDNVKQFGEDLTKENILGRKHYTNIYNEIPDETVVIKDPKNIRSEFAAYDPRFKDSSLLMAGGLAAPASTFNVDMNPLPDIKKGLGYYEQAKEAITKPLAQQLNIGKNPQDEQLFNTALKTGLDPVNYISGAAGLGLGAVQMLTPDENEIKLNALKKMQGGY